jgi:hypothetical protein
MYVTVSKCGKIERIRTVYSRIYTYKMSNLSWNALKYLISREQKYAVNEAESKRKENFKPLILLAMFVQHCEHENLSSRHFTFKFTFKGKKTSQFIYIYIYIYKVYTVYL